MKCSKCLKIKDKLEFVKKSRRCKGCRYNAFKSWYRKNKTSHNSKIALLRQKNREFIQDYKETHPCADCGKFFPFYVMDFDHLPNQEKCIAIARHGRQFNRETLINEIKKCDVVCSNCHRIRTWQRKK